MKNYRKLTTGIIAAWFLFALSASALQWFRNDANRIGITVAFAAVTRLENCRIHLPPAGGSRDSPRHLCPARRIR